MWLQTGDGLAEARFGDPVLPDVPREAINFELRHLDARGLPLTAYSDDEEDEFSFPDTVYYWNRALPSAPVGASTASASEQASTAPIGRPGATGSRPSSPAKRLPVAKSPTRASPDVEGRARLNSEYEAPVGLREPEYELPSNPDLDFQAAFKSNDSLSEVNREV